jgi:hypothetical protein
MTALMQQHRNLGTDIVTKWPSLAKDRYIKFYDACNTDDRQLMAGYLKTGVYWSVEWVGEYALKTVLNLINPLLGRGLTMASTARTVINASVWVIEKIDELRPVDHKFRYFRTRDGFIFLIETEFRKELKRDSLHASKENPHDLLVDRAQFFKIVQLLRELKQLRALSIEDKRLYLLRYHPDTILSCLSSIKDVYMADALHLICKSDHWNFLEQLRDPLQGLPGAATPDEAVGPFNKVCTALSLADAKTKLLFAKALAERWKIHATSEGENIVFFQTQSHGWWRSIANFVPLWIMRRLWCGTDPKKEQ